MRSAAVLALVGVIAGASGCATLTPTQSAAMLRPLDLALTSEPDGLSMMAAAGDAASQFALSIVLRYGLNGEAAKPELADVWRDRALAPRGTTQVVQYVPAFEGQAARTHLIPVPIYAFSAVEAGVNDACVRALAGQIDVAKLSGRTQATLCGGPDRRRAYEPLWAAASRRMSPGE